MFGCAFLKLYVLTKSCPETPKCLKGQLISKCLFGVFNLSQKTNENKSTWGIIVVKSNFFVRFWVNWGYQKDILKITDLYLVFKFTIGFLLFITIDVQVRTFFGQIWNQMFKGEFKFCSSSEASASKSFSRDGGRSENLRVRVVMRMA